MRLHSACRHTWTPPEGWRLASALHLYNVSSTSYWECSLDTATVKRELTVNKSEENLKRDRGSMRRSAVCGIKWELLTVLNVFCFKTIIKLIKSLSLFIHPHDKLVMWLFIWLSTLFKISSFVQNKERVDIHFYVRLKYLYKRTSKATLIHYHHHYQKQEKVRVHIKQYAFRDPTSTLAERAEEIHLITFP